MDGHDDPVAAGGDAGDPVATGGPVAVAPESVAPEPEEELVGTTGRSVVGRELVYGLAFLVPALLLLVGWLVYPVLFTIWRSTFDAGGDTFVGLDNYREMFERDSTRTAVRNNIIWVVAAPTLATSIGLIFAVLTERIRFATAFKVAIFMPMAISFLASGVIFRLVYQQNPDQGLANAMLTTVTQVFDSPGPYRDGRPSDQEALEPDGDAFTTVPSFAPGDEARLGIVGIRTERLPDDAAAAQPPPRAPPDGIAGTTWLDFTPGTGGERGVIDPGERGLPGMRVEALDAAGQVAGRASADEAGRFVIDGLAPGEYRLRLAAGNFAQPWTGFEWLGPTLVTPAVIGSFLWIWTGFAMVVIAAGLAAIPRETLEAARVDGANEWQVFRRVTAPLLWPVIMVVVVTLMINVLKIFDLVLVVPPGGVQSDANVIALELWRVSFGGARDQGLGSALGVFLFLLVIPAMAFNIRRFRSEEA